MVFITPENYSVSDVNSLFMKRSLIFVLKGIQLPACVSMAANAVTYITASTIHHRARKIHQPYSDMYNRNSRTQCSQYRLMFEPSF
jgi:hypothetical protein